MRTFKLTDEQANLLATYLLMSTQYRKDEFEACHALAQERREDGSVKFPKMEGNAAWWEKAEKQLSEIQKAIDAAPYEKE